MGSLDLPSQTDEPDRAKPARDASASRPPAGELPDPDERSRVYEATRAYFSAGAADEAGQGAESSQQADAVGQRGYPDEVPRFLEMLAEIEKRWSTMRQPAARLSSDAPGSHHKEGGFSSSAEVHKETIEVVSHVREVERGLSADVQAVEQENGYGGSLAGFEHRFKGEGRLREKVAEKIEAEPGMTASEALHEVADAIRYTYCFEPENYTRGYYDIKERLESRGYEMYLSNNYWTNPEYKGINTRWVIRDGQRFEVQLHTPDSFHAKHHMTHIAYERIRDPTTSDEERGELREFQREVSSWIEVPDGATEIPNYRKEGF
jgi:hypothetical protein